MPASETRLFDIPLWVDLVATFVGALSGATAAAQRKYDFIGGAMLAVVAGIGGALIRDGLFVQKGPPVPMQHEGYLLVCVGAALFTPFLRRLPARLTGLALHWTDTIGLGLYGMIGTQTAHLNGLGIGPSILTGVANAVGGGIARDLLINEESATFKPGNLYATAVIFGASTFLGLTGMGLPAAQAGAIGAVSVVAIRAASLRYNLRTAAME